MARPPTKMIPLVCPVCDKHFELAHWLVRDREGKAIGCSVPCTRFLSQKGQPNYRVPSNSFDREPGAAATIKKVKSMIDAGHNGAQICEKLGIKPGTLWGITQRNGWRIEKNLGRSAEAGNVRTAPLTWLICPACGKNNPWRPWQLKGKKSKFCNSICAGNTKQY